MHFPHFLIEHVRVDSKKDSCFFILKILYSSAVKSTGKIIKSVMVFCEYPDIEQLRCLPC